MGKKVLIVGGVAGGASAAARLRRLDENAQIIMFERGEYISFANCGLPYYIGGTIKERGKLLVQTEEGMEKRFNIDIRPKSEVVKIDREKSEVEVVSEGKTYRESYDYIILSPGAEPFVPNIKGRDTEGIFTLRNMADVDRIKEFVDNKRPNSAVVVGGGFIGVEMAENLKDRGVNVTLIEAMDQVMPPFDIEMSKLIEKTLNDNGVEVILKDAVEGFELVQNKILCSLKSGNNVETDMVVLAIGVRPENKLAKEAGLELGERGGIKTDEYLRTSDPKIYAVGDAIETFDILNGKPMQLPLAGPANKQGRTAADNIAGNNVKFKGVLGTSVIKVFDMTAASTGNNEKTLKRLNIPYVKSYTHSSSHAGYYPNAFVMNIKLIFSPEDGKILGAQIFGRDGVDKRIDVLATAIKAGFSVYDLEELELAYAPPYSSAKDPVNMAGFVAANILKGDVKIKHFDEIENLNLDEWFILDVRTDVEYQAGNIKNSVNIPVDTLRNNLNRIPKDKKIFVYCKIGLRGYIACRILTQNGFDAYNLSGGYDTYLSSKSITPKVKMNDEMTKIEKVEEKGSAKEKRTIKIDACGLQCPGPIMRVNNELSKIDEGDVLEVHVTDPGFSRDIKSWCDRTGNNLIGVEKTCCDYVAYISKGNNEKKSVDANKNIDANKSIEMPNGKTIVVFSGDLDKAIASFVIANGAVAMGRKVTMFFTFWGLNILRKDTYVKVNKTFIEKMFGFMLPRGSKKLKLSKMNMAGMGTRMMKGIMRKKNIYSLEQFIEMARNNGIKFIACSMSMDVMGIKKEELIDGVEIGGVATYLDDAEKSNVNLFI